MPGNFSKLVTVVTGQTITAAERNNEFDNIINNATADGIDDASATLVEMQATTSPAGGSQATSLRGEIQRLRFQILKLNSASGNWYDVMAWLSAITPATPGATATDLNNRLAQIVKHLQTLNVAAGNWYDTMSFLAGITPAAAGATGTDLTNRLAQIVSQIKNLGGLTNWYDVVTAALLKAGGTMAGNIAFGGSFKNTGLAAGSSAGDSIRYEQAFTRSMVYLRTGNGHGSTNTKIRRFTNTVSSTGTAITYADSATAGASFTVTEAGVYAISYTDNYTAGSTAMGLSLNSAQLTTNIDSITEADAVSLVHNPAANAYGFVSVVMLLAANDVIRPHTRGVNDYTTGSHFIMAKITL